MSGTATDAAGSTAPNTARLIVTWPSDPADFNGTVLLDWVNVTAQFENAADLMRRVCNASIRFGEVPGLCETYVPPPFDQPLPAAAPSAPEPVTAPAAAAPPEGEPRTGGDSLARTGTGVPLLAPFALLAPGLLGGARLRR